jgi:alkylhydroperoxidase family enzyme
MEPPRIQPVTDPTPEQAEELAKGFTIDGKTLNIFGTLAHHPRLMRRFSVLGGAFLQGGLLPEREREIVILRVGYRCASQYEFGQHTLIGRQAGLTDDEIEALGGAGEREWSAEDRALIDFADELCATNDVSDERWAPLAARWNEAELLELVLLAGFYRMVSGFLNTIRVELDPGVPGLPANSRQ